jgi:hypothetical protein
MITRTGKWLGKTIMRKSILPNSDNRADATLLNRREFLQLSGGAGAALIAGAAFIRSSEEPLPDTAESNRLAFSEPTPPSAEEAIALRHRRHRRQAMDGYIDTPLDPFNQCEHHCTAAMFAHQYGRSETWL